MKENNEHCCARYKSDNRDDNLVKTITNRLNRINGQVNGIKSMVEDNRYCVDILIQLSACEKALKSVGEMILKNHLSTCVVEKIKNGDENIIDETMKVIKNLK